MLKLKGTGVKFSVGSSEILLTCVQAKSSLVERIKTAQYEDEQLCRYLDEVTTGKIKQMIIDCASMLRLGNRLCVPDIGGLRRVILVEDHNSIYTMHPGSTKMYHDLKQFHL